MNSSSPFHPLAPEPHARSLFHRFRKLGYHPFKRDAETGSAYLYVHGIDPATGNPTSIGFRFADHPTRRRVFPYWERPLLASIDTYMSPLTDDEIIQLVREALHPYPTAA